MIILLIAIIVIATLIYYGYKAKIESDSKIESEKIKLEYKKLDLKREIDLMKAKDSMYEDTKTLSETNVEQEVNDRKKT